MIEAKVLADSIAPNGRRITTMEWKYPRAIHSEIMTHRALSRNAASSRAIPTEKLIQRVIDDPWIPSYIGKNQKGMQAGEELSESERQAVQDEWLCAMERAVSAARWMIARGVHKQVVNRIIEPWMWITVIVTATEWKNFDGLRDHEMAEPHFQELARKAKAARMESTPVPLAEGMWHLPLVDNASDDWLQVAHHVGDCSDRDLRIAMVKVSVGRCARVSYLTHDGRRDIKEDIALHDRLVKQVPLHASPLEHAAQALGPNDGNTWSGNIRGWQQYRKMLPFENLDVDGLEFTV